MLTKTTEAGIQALVFMALEPSVAPRSPRTIGESLGLSPSYMSKITRQLVRANILAAHRGARGGVTLRRSPSDILLLDIVQALQGVIVDDHCGVPLPGKARACGFHEAMVQVHKALIDVLSGWTLADLASRPSPQGSKSASAQCLMRCAVAAAGTTHRKIPT